MSYSTKTQERNRESNRKYFAKMSEEERKAFFRTRYQKYKASYKEQSKQWAKDNPHKTQASAHQARIKRAYPVAYNESQITTPELAVWLKYNRGKPCTYCGLPGTHIDHMIPLSKGGAHSWENICIACEQCNLMKSDYSVEEWKAQMVRILAHS